MASFFANSCCSSVFGVGRHSCEGFYGESDRFPNLYDALKEIELLSEAGDRLAQAVRTLSYNDELEMWEDMRKW
jgi:hypothetical protein